MTTNRRRITIIHSLDEIPEFASDEEEARFWDTHEMSSALWHSLPPIPDDELPPIRQDTQPSRKRVAG